MGNDEDQGGTGPAVVRCTQRAYLTVAPVEDADGLDFDPAHVTRLVGLEPTRIHRRGEAVGQRVHRSSGWYVDVPQREEYDTELVLRELLDVLDPHAEGLAYARQVLGLRAGVNVVIEMHSGRDGAGDILVTTPRIHLTAETMRRLADLCLWLDCDQYVY
ncbi:DUF4279 domain-containing protein [Micromonospora sp. NBC_01813]|uniref:DUF4279 domain-containing protein n=1 Tax=Micromonospora sp. NBC_01813 TaxID=2975988 RepID=UPI002DDA0B6E|nr:DUF4279 domain-containing protein [Micromonospora sp. NBC_01813]WSA06975.1 DUF4279 domain-containing protein [Micromonospora sp. NBC_01813]